MGHDTSLDNSVLGRNVAYKTEYDASLLFALPRQAKRDELGIPNPLPFFGIDIWNAYEISWLNPRGKPQIAIASFFIPADSPYIIESKSFKLYLNSFNQTIFNDTHTVQEQIKKDISQKVGTPIRMELTLPTKFSTQTPKELEGILLDRLDIQVEHYTPNAALLKTIPNTPPTTETLVSHLLKSNCLITGQPDWASIQIQYTGTEIDQASLLEYIISFRNHNEFHEQCVERIFMDILSQCKPQKLSVYARYTRRGGLDINPWRSNFSSKELPSNQKNARQ
jgi:7-cyano-7-deazaguanine reductase